MRFMMMSKYTLAAFAALEEFNYQQAKEAIIVKYCPDSFFIKDLGMVTEGVNCVIPKPCRHHCDECLKGTGYVDDMKKLDEETNRSQFVTG